jgi:small subunit ribosomal protein S20
LEGYFLVAKRTQSAKRHRQSLKNRARNYSYRSKLRTHIKRARLAIESEAGDKDEKTGEAMRELDRMVSKGVLHKNNAARRKSRLMRALHGEEKAPSTDTPLPEKPTMEKPPADIS